MIGDLVDRDDVAQDDPLIAEVGLEACAAFVVDHEAPGGPCLECGWLPDDHELAAPVGAPARAA